MPADAIRGFSVQHLVIRYGMPILGMILSVLIGVFISNSERNNLSTVVLLLGVTGFCCGALTPKRALYALIFLCGYLDMFKRLLLLFGDVGFEDLIYVLGTAPLTLLGVCVGTAVLAIFRRVRLTGTDLKIMALVAVLMGATLLVAKRDGGGARDLVNSMVNGGAYFTLLVLVGVLFQSEEELQRFLKVVVLGFLPVALYGVSQYVFGLADYEVAYLQSGLSVTEGNLYDIHPRPFSTLNSPHAFSVTVAILFLLSLYPLYRSRDRFAFLFGSPLRMLVPGIYLVASLLSLVRAGWLVWAIGLGAMFCFTRPRRTLALYAGTLSVFLLLVFNAERIERDLGYIESFMPAESAYSEQAFRLGTFTDRLEGFKNLTNSTQMYSLFGLPKEERGELTGSHDQVGGLLRDHGVVGVLFVVGMLGFGLTRMHQAVYRFRDRDNQRFAIVCLAAVFGVIFGGMVTGGHVGVFPINFLFWFLVGTLIKLVRLNDEERRTTMSSDEEDMPVEMGASPGRPAAALSLQS